MAHVQLSYVLSVADIFPNRWDHVDRYQRLAPMAASALVPAEYIHLIFSTNSLRNCLIQCDALGLHFQLSTPMDGLVKNERTTTITRWDPHEGKDIIIAEWQGKQIGSDRIRLNSLHTPGPLLVEGTSLKDGFITIGQFFPRTSGIPGFAQL